MVRAIIEALGAYISLAPMSDDATGFRTRQIAFVLVTAAFIAGAYLMLRR